MRLDELVRIVRPYAKGCPPILIEQQLILAARDFCEKTHAYAPTEQVSLGAGRFSIDLPEYEGEDVILLKDVSIGGRELVALARRNAALASGAGMPSVYYVTSDGVSKQIIFDRPADQRYRVDVTCVAKPSLGSAEFSDLLCAQFGETIAYGAGAAVLLQQDYDWFNPQIGELLQAKFNTAVAQAKITVGNGLVSPNTRVNPRRF